MIGQPDFRVGVQHAIDEIAAARLLERLADGGFGVEWRNSASASDVSRRASLLGVEVEIGKARGVSRATFQE